MTTLPFVSRHAPTDEQAALARQLGFDKVQQLEIALTAEAPSELKAHGMTTAGPIAMVGPLYVGLALLRAGFRVIEFVNDADARREGGFRCTGAYIHELAGSRFIGIDGDTPERL